MTFERTLDLGLVRKILTEPRAWRRMASDEAPAREHFRPQARPDLLYVIARSDAGRPLALFLLQESGGRVEVHFCFRSEPGFRRDRERALEAIGQAFLEWVWRHTDIDCLIGPVPGHNRLALRLAYACGFRPFAVERGAITRGGLQYDRILTSVYRREAEGSHAEVSTS